MYSELKQLIRTNKLRQAIDQTLLLLSDSDDSDILNSVTLISSQLASLERQEMNMSIRPDDANLRRNQITINFLNLLDQMKESGMSLKETDSESIPSSNIPQNEQDGLHKQAEMLIKKLNFFREKMSFESDPSKQFTLSTEIEKAEHELAIIKEKIRTLASQ